MNEGDPLGPAACAGLPAVLPDWQLRLYVAGRTAKSTAALANLKRLCARLCATHLDGRYAIEVVDLLVDPRLAATDRILAVPTLVSKLPEPVNKIIGDLSNEEPVLVSLDIQPPQPGRVTVTPDPQPPLQASSSSPPPGAGPAGDHYLLRPYVTGTSPRSARAIVNVRTICDRHLSGWYELQVIDISRSPGVARSAELVAAPTLVKHQPLPVRRFIGDTSQTERILRQLDLVDGGPAPWSAKTG